MAQKIDNLIEEIGKLTVLEAAELVKALEEKLGVSAAMPMAAAPAAGAVPGEAAQQEEKTELKVELIDAGPEKIKTIKALRQVTSLNLSEAKKLYEDAQLGAVVIAEVMPRDEAKKAQEALEAAGAKVKLS